MNDEAKIPLPRSLQEIVGALLFASETPLTAADLRAAVKAVEPEAGDDAELADVYRTCTGREIDAAVKGLEKALEVAGAGFRLVCAGGAYRLQTEARCGRYVRALLKLDRPSRLGRASLETLAIVAYRQPVTKSEIEEIRGVDVAANLKTLLELQLVRLVGRSELPGHPFLYGTTALFLEHFGLKSLEQLNELDPTLQRSNPRLKAAAYRKPVTGKTELEQAAEAAAAERAAEPAAEAVAGTDAGSAPDVEQGELLPEREQDGDDAVFVNPESIAPDCEKPAGGGDDGDEFDAEDEFDEEDEFDDEEDEDEEDEFDDEEDEDEDK